MSASLVGSEMCIRDRSLCVPDTQLAMNWNANTLTAALAAVSSGPKRIRTSKWFEVTSDAHLVVSGCNQLGPRAPH
eukprot:9492655-Alexandrium_andersonii.AAC.1